MTAPGNAPSRVRAHLPELVWLVLVWILLWGTWSWANLLSGLVVALLVLVLLPLPPVVGGARVRPVALLRFVAVFLVDVVVSGAQVAWLAVRPGGRRQSAVVRVRLRTDSDLLLTVIAETLSLVPGSLLLDLDREEKSLTLHLLHVRDAEDLERQKLFVLATEERVVRAFGTAEDIAGLGPDPEPAGGRPS